MNTSQLFIFNKLDNVCSNEQTNILKLSTRISNMENQNNQDGIKSEVEKQISKIKIGTIFKKPSYFIDTFEVIEIHKEKMQYQVIDLGVRFIVKPLNEIGHNETVWEEDLKSNDSIFKIQSEDQSDLEKQRDGLK